MSYSDMFASRRSFPTTHEDDELVEPIATPQPAVQTVQPVDTQQAEPDIEPLIFEGFASNHPLLLERPSRYVNRVKGAAVSLFTTPDNNPDSRILYSPAIALPFFVLQGDETFNADTIQYPLLHMPANHPYDGNISIDLYALSLMVALSVGGYLYEPSRDELQAQGYAAGALLAYGITDTNFMLPDELWNAAYGWAESNMKAIAALNMARLTAFSQNNPDEQRIAKTLFDSWGVDDNPAMLMADGKDAAQFLQVGYDAVTENLFEPFNE